MEPTLFNLSAYPYIISENNMLLFFTIFAPYNEMVYSGRLNGKQESIIHLSGNHSIFS
jgi:hypothetical protein